MSPNAYAHLIENVHTITVKFYGERNDYRVNELGAKDYTYLADRAYEEGDHVIVDVSGVPKCVYVTSCDVGVALDQQKELKWVLGPAYTQEAIDFCTRVTAIKKQVAHVYNTSAKKRMRDVMLAELGVSSVEELLQIGGGVV